MLYGELPETKLDSGETVHGVVFKVPNPPKSAVLRLPTNAEMLERLNAQKSIRRTLGRRKSQTEAVKNPQADLELFAKIRLDKGIEFDAWEARNAISKLTQTEVIDCHAEGGEYAVTLKTPFGETVHSFAVPTVKDLETYRAGIIHSVDMAHGQEEMRFRVSVAADLYDSTVTKITGYAPDWTKTEVPPHHKFSVVIELVQSVDEADPGFDPNA